MFMIVKETFLSWAALGYIPRISPPFCPRKIVTSVRVLKI